MDEYPVICECTAEFGWLLELTVPVGVGNTNGLVGVPELDEDVDLEDVDADVDGWLALIVLT